MDDIEKAIKERAREWGKQGGRPRTVPHVEGWAGCRCAGCRAARKGREPEGVIDPGDLAAEKTAVESGVPAGWVLVGAVATAAGVPEVPEEAVEVAALKEAGKAHMKKLGDGRRVVVEEWARPRIERQRKRVGQGAGKPEAKGENDEIQKRQRNSDLEMGVGAEGDSAGISGRGGLGGGRGGEGVSGADRPGLTLGEEIEGKFREVMRENPEADEGVIRRQVTGVVKEERRLRAEAEMAEDLKAVGPSLGVPKTLEELKAAGLLKLGSEVKRLEVEPEDAVEGIAEWLGGWKK